VALVAFKCLLKGDPDAMCGSCYKFFVVPVTHPGAPPLLVDMDESLNCRLVY
jgi:hypothetical protein